MNRKPTESGSLRILIIEDNADDILMIRRALEELETAEVQRVFSQGTEALQWLLATAEADPADLPDVIFLDINLPQRTGLEVLQDLRAHASLAGLPVMMLTSSDRECDLQRAYSSGATSYITKPFQFSHLKATVHEAVRPWLRPAGPD